MEKTEEESHPNGTSPPHSAAAEKVGSASSPPLAIAASLPPPVHSVCRALSIPSDSVPSQKKLRREFVRLCETPFASPPSPVLSESRVSPSASPAPCYLLDLDATLLLSLLRMLSPREQLESVLPLCRSLYLSLSSLPFLQSLVLKAPGAFASFFAPDRPLAMARACCLRCCRVSCFSAHAEDTAFHKEGEEARDSHPLGERGQRLTGEPAGESRNAAQETGSSLRCLPECMEKKTSPGLATSAVFPDPAAAASSASGSSASVRVLASPSRVCKEPLSSSALFPFFLHLRKCSKLEVVDICIPGSITPSPLLLLFLLRCAPRLRRLTVRGLDEGSVSWRMRRRPLAHASCEPCETREGTGPLPPCARKFAVFWPCRCRKNVETKDAESVGESASSQDAPTPSGIETGSPSGAWADLPPGDAATDGNAPQRSLLPDSEPRTEETTTDCRADTSSSPSLEISGASALSCPSLSVSPDDCVDAVAARLCASSSGASPRLAAGAAPCVHSDGSPQVYRQLAPRGCASCESVAASASLLASVEDGEARGEDLWLPARPLARLFAEAVCLETLELEVSRRRGMYATFPLAEVSLLASSLGTQALARLRDLEICNATPKSFKCGAICLPSLRRLRLHFVEVASDNVHDLDCLLAGCPHLETLAVHTDSDDDQMIFLNRLLIKSLRRLAGDDSNEPARDLRDAPSSATTTAFVHAAGGEVSGSRLRPRLQQASSAALDGEQRQSASSPEPRQAGLPRLKAFQMMLLDLRVIHLLAGVAPGLRVLRLTEVDSFRCREGRTVLMEAVRHLRQLQRVELLGVLLEAEGKIELDSLLAAEAESRGWGRDALTLGHGSSVAQEFFIPCM
ncbi:hypothetical protein TGME49_299240 [Toxoplasma gondii ME49]|uniref:F-box/LRR-repeat protein 15/At3g58940/PEG3-like LRR domain-containing protein n=3 Tax=Toxoplasma gondii TaxID=5811 RepID=A0A125YFG5_TOXGV|nr:hypothetical protein TGME49_299240 [Toxoplasma gondii ME49]EPT31654.1 hypothetical protein TGME49_299240 [Toxoplasma gondii ME49]ESS30412.1 hypothetical protein TGVEG_299240 [Toxoplasma gondii VEG]KFG35367.1 hypothetical protein TGDOM2_299240 [Toxoplasma gondii GAB2-2007-GAL-DOM2]CEL72359.1 TPA: hypothetical protein BN1205_105000 [Toxoplasma gondii VEG]|eukprot:XP_018638103.1 hypothetical protein TGME49_299240 [Toxoplasma gondii ME49]